MLPTPDYPDPAADLQPWNSLAVVSLVLSVCSVPLSLLLMMLIASCGVLHGVDGFIAFLVYVALYFGVPSTTGFLSIVAMAWHERRGSWMAVVSLLICIVSPLALVAFCAIAFLMNPFNWC